MAQTNFTPILLYASSTPTNVPSAANLTNSATGSEIAINVADKNLFFKDSGGTVNTVPIRQSSTSSNGWLSNTDWNTFNNKSNTNGTVTSVAALTLGTTGTDLSSTVANGTTTPVITLQVPTASATNRGALSSTDWSTFNGKQAALVSGTNIKTVGGVTLLGSGDVGTIGTGYGGTGQTSFTAGYVHFGSFSTDSNFFWDNTNKRLGINTVTPGYPLDVSFGGGNIARFINTSGRGYVRFDGKSDFTHQYYVNGASVGFIQTDSGGTEFMLGTLGAYPLEFWTNSTEKMRVHSSGGVSIGNTTDAGAGNLRLATTETNGIYFGASSKLADYEEGTWTPQPTFGLGNTGMAYTSSGVYRKIGKFVHLQGTIQFSAKGSSTGIFRINTIPYANINGYGSGAGVVPYYANLTGIAGSFVTRIDAGNATYILPGYDDTGAGPGLFTETNFTNTSRIDLHLIYETA